MPDSPAEPPFTPMELLRQSIADTACDCDSPVWRGGLCEYHRGFVDGIEAAREKLADEC